MDRPPTAGRTGAPVRLGAGSADQGQEWTAPGAFEVVPNVYRIPLPLPNDGLRAVNVYAILGDDGVAVIDSGWAVQESRDALTAGLAELGCSLGDITRFLVTHIHHDHYTQAVVLRREYDVIVSLGSGERQTLEHAVRPGGNDLAPQVAYMRELGAGDIAARLAAGEHFADLDIWGPPDEWLDGGEEIAVNGRRLDVVPTPGHTHGHVVFHDDTAALLFAGDHVLPTITPSIGFEPVLSPNPLGDYLGSLAAVRSLPDAMLLPAHGPVSPSVHRRVDELLEHHSARLEQTAAAVRAGASTAYAAAGTLRWTRRERTLADLDTLNQMLAVAETNAHLLLLAAQGRVHRSIEDGVQHYAPA